MDRGDLLAAVKLLLAGAFGVAAFVKGTAQNPDEAAEQGNRFAEKLTERTRSPR